MLDKYYGDNRDLLKWAILLHLAEQYRCKKILQIAYYRKTDFGNIILDGKENQIMPDVVKFFRNLDNIKKISPHRKIEIFKEIFDYRKPGRQMYQSSVIAKIAEQKDEKAVVFLDPDTGLGTGKQRKKHVLKSECREIWDALGFGFVFVLYQHRFRQKNWKEIRKRELAEGLGLAEAQVRIAEGPAIAKDVIFYYVQKRN